MIYSGHELRRGDAARVYSGEVKRAHSQRRVNLPLQFGAKAFGNVTFVKRE